MGLQIFNIYQICYLLHQGCFWVYSSSGMFGDQWINYTELSNIIVGQGLSSEVVPFEAPICFDNGAGF